MKIPDFLYISIKFAVFTENEKTRIDTKQNPIIFVLHFYFLSDKNCQTVGQLSSNSSEDFAKTVHDKISASAVIKLSDCI